MVVQPNVMTKDEKAGVHSGELVRVTEKGFEGLHACTVHGWPGAMMRTGGLAKRPRRTSPVT
jgi:hypothetical protein